MPFGELSGTITGPPDALSQPVRKEKTLTETMAACIHGGSTVPNFSRLKCFSHSRKPRRCNSDSWLNRVRAHLPSSRIRNAQWRHTWKHYLTPNGPHESQEVPACPLRPRLLGRFADGGSIPADVPRLGCEASNRSRPKCSLRRGPNVTPPWSTRKHIESRISLSYGGSCLH
jgi:hypothetical protein